MRQMLIAMVAGTALAAPVVAQPTTRLTTRLVMSGLSRPVYVTQAPGDDDRLFVLEQHTGQIRIYKNSTGVLNATPFMTQTGLSTGNEQGLLGLAFHPSYQTNGYFYIYYTDNAGGTSNVRRYQRFNADTANPSSALQVVRVTQPFSNHNGGCIQFGSDGFLYIGFGDGGSANDPGNRAQTLTEPLGKMWRIDVDRDDYPTDPNKNYGIPQDNPFARGGGLPEIWFVGLRNPWRWSFDRLTGDTWIADVGQNAWEEINSIRGRGVGGENFGWRCMEGLACTGLTGCTCNAPTLINPVQVYSHSQGCSVTGGYVYRGSAIPDLRGTYFYGDYCTSAIWSFRLVGGVVTQFQTRTTELDPPGTLAISSPTSFGEDNAGEMYIVDQGGEVFKLMPNCYADCDRSTGLGVLDIFDFTCFQNAFAASQAYADCDVSTGVGVFDIFDFLCFQNAFAAGCP